MITGNANYPDLRWPYQTDPQNHELNPCCFVLDIRYTQTDF